MVAQKWEHFRVEVGDLLVSTSGTIGRVSVTTEAVRGAIPYTGIIRMRPAGAEVDSGFLRYFLTSPLFAQQATAAAAGSVLKHFGPSHLREMSFLIPPLPEQRAIADVLAALDDKIEHNRRTSRALEGLTRAMFKAWFVDFEPVHAKAAGATAYPGMPPEAFAALPTNFTGSPLGPVPRGWELRRLQDVLTLHYGKSLNKTQRVPGTVPVYGSGGVNGMHSESLVPGPGIIVGRKGSVGTLYWEDQAFFPIDTTFYVEPTADLRLHYLFELLHTLGLETMNTDAAVPGLNRDNAYRLDIAVPPSALAGCFEEQAESLRDLVSHLAAECRKLAELRDYLLPKLLSGDVRIGAAGRAAAGARG